MVIKRKNGSVYRLSRPNPIMKNQSFWDEDKSVVHNFHPEEIVTKEAESLQDMPAEEIYVQIKDIDPSKLPPNTKKKVITIHKEIVHCLPATIKEFRDPLYNEVRSSITYGNKFTMEVVVASQTDLNLTFWTTIPIDKGSIIYRPVDKRWWRVTDSTMQNEGFMVSCTPSDLQPSFEVTT